MTALAPTVLLERRRTAHRNEGSEWRRVSTRSGEHLGFVDATADGSLIAFDRYSTPVGRYPALLEAKRALRDLARGETRTARTARIAQQAAATSGAFAMALLISAAALSLLV
jgi:hypothetical protein